MNETVKFRNKNGFIKRWGSSHPLGLEKVILYLNRNNFLGPMSWKDPSCLEFIKNIDEDFFVKLIISGVYENPCGVINFDICIVVCSKLVGEVELLIDLWEINPNTIESSLKFPYAALFSADLSHLKWNVVQGENPCWQVVIAPLSIELAFEAWEQDWERFGVPFVNQVKNARDAIDTFFNLQDYKKSPWVKSNMPQTYSFFEHGIILLALNEQLDDAKSLLLTWSENMTELKMTMRPIAFDFQNRRLLKLEQWLSEKRP